MVPEWLDDPYRVSTPGDKILVSHIRYKRCQIDMGGKKFDVDLVKIGMNDFNVILSMDWLAKNFAQIDCGHKRVNSHYREKKNLSMKGMLGRIKISPMNTY